MATDVQRPPEQSLNTLVGGIVSDLQTLVKQQLQLTRKEIRTDLVKAGQAATMGIIGLVLTGLGGIVFSLALALLLYWLVAPTGTDPSRLPLWGCFGLVSLLLLAIGGTVSFLGLQKVEKLNPLEHTTQALEENLEWPTKSTPNRS